MDGPRRSLVLALAVAALVLVGGAAAVVALAPDSAPVLLGVLLALLVGVVAAEVVLLALARRGKAEARPRAPLRR